MSLLCWSVLPLILEYTKMYILKSMILLRNWELLYYSILHILFNALMMYVRLCRFKRKPYNLISVVKQHKVPYMSLLLET